MSIFAPNITFYASHLNSAPGEVFEFIALMYDNVHRNHNYGSTNHY